MHPQLLSGAVKFLVRFLFLDCPDYLLRQCLGIERGETGQPGNAGFGAKSYFIMISGSPKLDDL